MHPVFLILIDFSGYLAVGLLALAFFIVWNVVKYFNPGARLGGVTKGLVAIGVCVFLFKECGSSDSTAQASSNEPSQAMQDYVDKTHHCTWCGKEYHGNGYRHVMNTCVEGSELIDVQCSQKCCFDSWNAGNH